MIHVNNVQTATESLSLWAIRQQLLFAFSLRTTNNKLVCAFMQPWRWGKKRRNKYEVCVDTIVVPYREPLNMRAHNKMCFFFIFFIIISIFLLRCCFVTRFENDFFFVYASFALGRHALLFREFGDVCNREPFWAEPTSCYDGFRFWLLAIPLSRMNFILAQTGRMTSIGLVVTNTNWVASGIADGDSLSSHCWRTNGTPACLHIILYLAYVYIPSAGRFFISTFFLRSQFLIRTWKEKTK